MAESPEPLTVAYLQQKLVELTQVCMDLQREVLADRQVSQRLEMQVREANEHAERMSQNLLTSEHRANEHAEKMSQKLLTSEHHVEALNAELGEYRRRDRSPTRAPGMEDADSSEILFQRQDRHDSSQLSTPKTSTGEFSKPNADNSPAFSLPNSSPLVEQGQNGVGEYERGELRVAAVQQNSQHQSLPHNGRYDGVQHGVGEYEREELRVPAVQQNSQPQSFPQFGGYNEHQTLPHNGRYDGVQHGVGEYQQNSQPQSLPQFGGYNEHQTLTPNGRYGGMQHGVGEYERDGLRVPAVQQHLQHVKPPLQKQNAIRGQEAFRQSFGDQFADRRRSRMEARPDKFDGRVSLREYLVHFESCGQINGWGEDEKATWLAASLKPDVIMALTGDRQINEMTYEEMVNCLEKRFGPVQSPENYLNELKGRRRLVKESLREFAQDIRRLSALAYPAFPPDLKDQMARDHFKDAVDDPEIRAAIFRAKPATMDEALSASLDMESFLRTERGRARGRPPFGRAMQEQEMVPDDRQWKQKMMANMQRLIDGQNSQQNQNYPPRAIHNNSPRRAAGPNPSIGGKQVGACHHCGSVGHYVQFCPHRSETKNLRHSGNDNRSLQRVMGGPVNMKTKDPNQLETSSQPIASIPSRESPNQ